MATKLAKDTVGNIKPGSKPIEMRDAKVPGLIFRVQPSGVRSYIVEWARGKRTTLGRHPTMTLATARTCAMRALAEAAEHGEPNRVRRKAKGRTEVRTFGDFIRERYAPHLLATAKAGKATLACIAKHYAHLYAKDLAAISRADFDTFKAARLRDGIQPVTVNRDLDRLKAALGMAVEWELLATHPLKAVRRIKRGIENRVRYLSRSEESALRRALQVREDEASARRESGNAWRAERGRESLPSIQGYVDHLQPITLLALNTGLRRGELTQLTWADIDLAGKTLTVRAGYAKSGKARHVPLNAESIAVLKRWRGQRKPKPADRLFAVASIATSWAGLMNSAGIDGFRFHDCRHTFASKLVMAGVDLNTVRELLGHGDIKMTLRYAHLAPERLAEAVARLAT